MYNHTAHTYATLYDESTCAETTNSLVSVPSRCTPLLSTAARIWSASAKRVCSWNAAIFEVRDTGSSVLRWWLCRSASLFTISLSTFGSIDCSCAGVGPATEDEVDPNMPILSADTDVFAMPEIADIDVVAMPEIADAIVVGKDEMPPIAGPRCIPATGCACCDCGVI